MRLVFLFLLSVSCFAQTSFWTAAGVTTVSTMADSYTTSWFLRNWNRERDFRYPYGFRGISCAAEGSEPYLYGVRPSPARAYGVGIGKIAFAVGSSYLLKHSRHRWLRDFWPTPMVAITSASLYGFSKNMENCQ